MEGIKNITRRGFIRVSAVTASMLSVSLAFSKRIFAEVKNILDKKYYTVAGYPDFGRLFMFGITIK